MMLGDARTAIDEVDYPLTTTQLVAACGEYELAVPSGSETVADALGRVGEETYDGPEEARLAVYAGVSAAAVGRRHYSDRDPTPPGSDYGPEQVSF